MAYSISSGITSDGIILSSDTLFVSSGGVVNNATVNENGYLHVSKGGIANNITVNNSGSVFIKTGGNAYSTIINGGILRISSGGTASFTTLNEKGYLHVSSSAFVNNTTVNSNGQFNISKGGTANYTTINGGILCIFNGGSADKTYVNAGGSLIVSDGGSADNTYVYEGGSLVVSDGGTAISTVVSEGNIVVSSGGLVSSADVYGIVDIMSGGTASGLLLVGSLTISCGGVADDVGFDFMRGGYLCILSGGTATNVSLSEGTRLNITVTRDTRIQGTIRLLSDILTTRPFEVKNGFITSCEIGAYDCLIVSSGGSARDVTVKGGGNMYVYSGGYAESTDVYGNLYVESGGTAFAYVNGGGRLYVSNGGSAFGGFVEGKVYVYDNGVAVGFDVDNNGSVVVSSGGKARYISTWGGKIYVEDGGTTESATVKHGRQYVSSGGIASGTILRLEGALIVSSGGTAVDTLVDSEGILYVSSGGIADNTTINSLGSCYISSGALVNRTTICSGGVLYVSGGCTVDNTVIGPGGILYVSSGGSASNIAWTPCEGSVFVDKDAYATFISQYSGVYYGSANELLSQAQTMESMNLSSSCSMYVMSNGQADHTTVDSFGSMFVSNGGVANNTTVNNWGYLQVSNGGIASDTTVNDGGSMFVFSNGSANGVVNSGRLVVFNGGAINDAVNHGKMAISDGGVANSTMVNSYGCLYISSGGTANGVEVNSYARVDVNSGGSLNGATVNELGSLYITDGAKAAAIKENGGYVQIAANTEVSFASNLISGGTLHDGRTMTLHSGTTATEIKISGNAGYFQIFNGGVLDNTTLNTGNEHVDVYDGGLASNMSLLNGGYISVYGGGTAANTTVNSGGNLTVSNGGTANGATVNSNGRLIVDNGGMASNIEVNSYGRVDIVSGARLTGKMIFKNGATVSVYSGSFFDFDLTDIETDADALVNDLSLVQGTPVYTLSVDGEQASGNYVLAKGAAGFNQTITVVSVAGSELGSITVGQTTNIEGVDYSLALAVDGSLEVMVVKTFCVYRNSLINDYVGKENNGTITLSFTEKIDESSFSMDLISLTDKNGGTITVTGYEISGNKLTLNYEPLMDEGTYTLNISSALRSIKGHALDQNQNSVFGEEDDAYALHFTADFTAPKVVKVLPDKDFAGTLATLQITFSGAIDIDSLSGQISLIGPNGQIITPTSYKQLTASCIEVTVPEQTAYGQYQIKVGNQVCDLAGNRLDQNGDGIFGGADDNYVSTFNITKIDLKVLDVALNKTTFHPGETVNVSWTDYNNGGYALSGSWTDGIYLSTDTRWDVNDILLGNLTHEGGLAQDQLLSNSLSVSLAGVPTGVYYLLVRSDIYMQEKGDRESALAAQNLEAVEITVEMPELAINSTLSGHVTKSGDYAVYHFTQDANESLRLVLDSKTDSANMEIYVGNGYVPTREKYDSKVQRFTDGSLLLNAPDAANSVYVMVYAKDAKAAFDFDLSVESVPMSITQVSGSGQGNRNGSIFELTGVAFAPGMTVCLTDQSGNKYTAENVTFINTSRVNAEFFAGSLSSGRYTLSVNHDGKQADYYETVTISEKSGTDLNIRFVSPSDVGWKSISTLYVEYSNSGYDVMDAPLVIVHPNLTDGREGAFLTLDKSILTDGFWTSTKPAGFEYSVQMLASGNQPGYLEADPSGMTSYRIPVYYASWQTPWPGIEISIDWGVSYIESSNTSKLDWEKYLLDAGKTEAQTAFLVKNLAQSIGTTWGDYVKMLNRNMRYLYENGIPTDNASVTDLFNLEYKWASGAIAGQKELSSNTDSKFGTDLVSLNLTRKYYSGFDSRLSTSSFGVGWTCSWDMSLEIAENGDLTFDDGEDSRVYQPNYSNGYQTVANDGSVMKKLKDGGYQLTESDGTVRLFDANGLQTDLVDGDGNKTTFSYENGKLVRLTAGTEIWTITRNAAGLITSVTDQNGFVRSYGYDAENRLVSVTDSDGGTATYAYDGKSLGGLASISGNDAAAFSYDENGRLVSVVRDGHTYAYDYGVTGKVSVSRDGMTVGTNYYGLNGSLVKTIAADNATAGYIVTGCLTDANGAALAGITVNAIADGKVFSSVTDANGAYVFAGLQETFLNLIVQDDAYLSLDEYLTVDGITFADRTLVQAKNSVSGTYTYADAAESATVILTDKATGESSIISGYAGKFAAYDLKVGEYDLQISAGDSAVFRSSFSVTEESKYQTLSNFDLKVGGNLSCTVTADSVQDNVFAVLYDSNGAVAAVDQLSSSGAFTFENIAEGTYTLTISSPWGGADVSQEVMVTALKTSEVQIHLDDGICVSGVIENANGAAMPGLYLLLSDGENEQLTYTGKDGDYSFEHLLPGDYTLSVLDNGMQLESFSVTAGQQDLVFSNSLEYVASWSGRLHDAEGQNASGIVSLYLDGEYLDSVYTSDGYFRFDVAKEGNYSVVVESDAGFFQTVDSAALVSDSAKFSDFTLGTISLTVQSENLPDGETYYLLSQLDAAGNIVVSNYSYEPEFTGLTAGKYRLTAYNGNCKAESEFDVSEDMELKVAFEQLNELKIQLQDIREALNLLLYDGNGELVDTLYIDESGIYTFTALEAANYKLVAFSDNYNAVKDVTVTAGDADTISLTLEESLKSISGTVTVDGIIEEGATVCLYDNNGYMLSFAYTDSNGRFSINANWTSAVSLSVSTDYAFTKHVDISENNLSNNNIDLLSANAVGSDLYLFDKVQDDKNLSPFIKVEGYILWRERNDMQKALENLNYIIDVSPNHAMTHHSTGDGGRCKKIYDSFSLSQNETKRALNDAMISFINLNDLVEDYKRSVGMLIPGILAGCAECAGLGLAAGVYSIFCIGLGLHDLVKNFNDIVQLIGSIGGLVQAVWSAGNSIEETTLKNQCETLNKSIVKANKELEIAQDSLTKEKNSLWNKISKFVGWDNERVFKAQGRLDEVTIRKELLQKEYEKVQKSLKFTRYVSDLLRIAGGVYDAVNICAKYDKVTKTLKDVEQKIEMTSKSYSHVLALHDLLPNCPCRKEEDENPPNPEDGKEIPSVPTTPSRSVDPNDKTVTEGFGEAGFVSAGTILNYKVEFENDPKWATAPARWVRVYDTLANEFDLDTFELKSICIAGNYIEVGDGRDSYNELRELTIKGEKVLTQISVNLDYETRQLFAEFTAIDPETGWMLQDVLRGFLLPNDEIGSGEGFFTYSVALKEDIAHGTEITNTAKIYFDFNDPIDTPTTLNTVDSMNPAAAFTASVDGTEIKLALNGTDADSGIAGYNILYSSDGENFSDYGYTTDAEVSITGSSDTVYYFKIQAVDNVGNVSGWSDIKSIKTAGEYPDKPTVSADIVETTNQDVTLTAHFSKDSVIKEYSFDCEEWYVYSDGIVVSENGMVYFRGTNAMGKVSEVASFEVNNIDRIAPDTPIASANITSVTNEDVLVSAVFSDDSVIKEYSFDGQTWSKYEDAVKFTYNGTVSFRGIDAAGNVSEISTYDVRNIDKIAPEAPTVSSNAATAVYGGILVTATFTDDSVVREYSLDRQNWLPYTTAILFTSNGSVSFRGTDEAGNVSEVTTYVVSNNVDPANKPDDGKNDYLWTKKLGWNTANILVANTIADNGEIYLDQPGSIEIGGKHNLFGNDGTNIDAGDVARIEVSTAAKLTFRIDSNAAGTFYVYQDKRNKKGERERITVGKVAVKAGKTATLKDICLTADGSYYVAMIAKNVKKAGTEGLYNVSVTSSTFFADADNGSNDIALKGKMVSVGRGTQAITLDNEPMTESSEFANFVGFSDNIDYAKLDLASSTYLSFDLKADGTAKFTIWKQDAKGKLTKVGGVTSLTAKNGYKTTTKAQFLDTSKYTYYVSMESTDAAKGGSAYYNVELNGKTLFFDSADTGANNVLYDKKAKAFKNDANFVTTELADGSQDVLLDSNAIGNEAYGNFVGYGDAADYAKIVLTQNGSLSFKITALSDVTFELWQKGTDKKGKSVLTSLQKKTEFKVKDYTAGASATTAALTLDAGEYYISVTAKNTKANKKGGAFYNVTARFTASDSAATSLAMPETGSFAMTDNLTFGQYDASAAGGLSDFALQNIFEATDNGNLASL